MAKIKLSTEWRIWLTFGVLFVILGVWLYFMSRPPTEGGEYLWRVMKVTDKDTLSLKGSGQSIDLTLIGVKIPQSDAQAAKDYLTKTLQDNWVRVDIVRDNPKGPKGGRVYYSGEDITSRMVRQGLAGVDREETAFDVRPLIELENEAKREHKGVWRKSE